MTIKAFFSFRHNLFFWGNLLAMVVVAGIVLFAVLRGLDSYTRHGEAVVVPDVRGMRVSEAEVIFRNRGLNIVVSDSNYVKDQPAGCILEYNPSVGQKVKEGRTIYLTINTQRVPLYDVPDVADNSSLREAVARLQGAGFKVEEVEYMVGERDWVYGIKYRGRMLGMNEKVPAGAALTLMVGGGEDYVENDSIDGGIDAEYREEEPAASEKSASDESWF